MDGPVYGRLARFFTDAMRDERDAINELPKCDCPRPVVVMREEFSEAHDIFRHVSCRRLVHAAEVENGTAEEPEERSGGIQ